MNYKRTTGSAYLVVIVFATILFIFMVMLGKVRSGQFTLMSKSAKEFLATTLAEAALHNFLSELRYDPDFRTHEIYRVGANNPWVRPVKNRPSNLSSFKDFRFYDVKDGIYYGENQFGKYKLRAAKIFGKNDRRTQTLMENRMYMRAEVVAFVGTGKRPEDDAYRKIDAYIIKRSPVSEYLLFDGEMLEMAYGPYEKIKGEFRRGRLYGYQWLTFPRLSGNDKGVELLDMEKIESPGMIRAMVDTPITFANKKQRVLNATNDSASGKFDTALGYILDGNNGAAPIKFNSLPREYIFAKAKRKGNGGFFIEPKTYPPSKWKNPYDPKTEYFDLNFGEFRTGQNSPDEPSNEDEEENEDEESEEPPPYGSDDPEGIRSVPGKRLLIYSKVPLRIWGCPDRTITIFCEKDVVISGDFNQNPNTPQDYPDANFINYKTVIKNGKDYHKVGALIMSAGRIFIDVSRPTLFTKNEVKPFFMYQLAMCLDPNFDEFPNIAKETKAKLCPIDPEKRRGIVGEESGKRAFLALSWLHTHEEQSSGEPYDDAMDDIINFFTPAPPSEIAKKPRFGIKDEIKRKEIIAEVEKCCRQGGDITREEFDRIFNMAWQQAIIEEETSPDPSCGPMGLLNALFDAAHEDFTDGLHVPEITINAALVSSTRRSSTWKIGSVISQTGSGKVFDEIGNAPANEFGIIEYMKKPRFIIQRVYGSEIRLGISEPTYFVSGKFSGQNILRRRIWDRSLTRGDYQPSALPFAFNIQTYSDHTITKREFDTF